MDNTASLAWRMLQSDRDKYMRTSLAESTLATYSMGVRQYAVFCSEMNVNMYPLNEMIMELFCVSLAARVGYKTIKVYLCGVQLSSVLHGFSQGIRGMHRLHYLLRGIRRSQGNSHKRPPRTPVTLDVLRRALLFIRNNHDQYDAHMLSAAILLAFLACLGSPSTRRHIHTISTTISNCRLMTSRSGSSHVSSRSIYTHPKLTHLGKGSISE